MILCSTTQLPNRQKESTKCGEVRSRVPTSLVSRLHETTLRPKTTVRLRCQVQLRARSKVSHPRSFAPHFRMRFVVIIPAAGSGVAEFDPLPPTIPFQVAVEKDHVRALAAYRSNSHRAAGVQRALDVNTMKYTPTRQFYPIAGPTICCSDHLVANRNHIRRHSDFAWLASNGVRIQWSCLDKPPIGYRNTICVDGVTEWTVALDVCWIQVVLQPFTVAPRRGRISALVRPESCR